MRIKLSKGSLKKLRKQLLSRDKISEISKILRINRRTLNGWLLGQTTISGGYFLKLLRFLGIKKEELKFKELKDYWNVKNAGKKGGKIRALSGASFGDHESRRRGGINSLKAHKNKKTRFYNIKTINIPRSSSKLAEFLGIIFGDGHLSKYQVLFTTNSKTDRQHAIFVKKLFKELFGLDAVLKYKNNENTVCVVASSIELIKYLEKLGMPSGNKIQRGLKIPRWILANKKYRTAFFRGLFDTDGSVYLDKHSHGNKAYEYCCLAFTSYSPSFLKEVCFLLEDLGLEPTNKPSQKSVFIRKRKNVINYFKIINSHNDKHLQRYYEYIGEVPKRS